MNLDILMFANQIHTEGVSGGDVRFIEIAGRLMKRNIQVRVVTSAVGAHVCRRLGLDAEFHISDDSMKGSFTQAYAKRAVTTCLDHLPVNKDTVLYSCSDFICDVLPASYYKLKTGAPWIAVIHWIEPSPWRRGIPLGTRWGSAALYNLSQMFSSRIINWGADAIHGVSTHTLRQILNLGMDPAKARAVECGIDHQLIDKYTSTISNKEFDGLYMKGLAPHKGIFDALKAWSLVCREIKDAKLAIIGAGEPDIMEQVNRLIRELDLERNITNFGPIFDQKLKFRIMKRSKVLLQPSYDENWSIVIGEAMSCGLPVIAYELPVLMDVWKEGMINVPLGNIPQLSKAILELLNDANRLAKISKTAKSYSSRYDWDTVTDREVESIKLVLGKAKKYPHRDFKTT